MRVYELSKQLNIPSKQLVEALQEKGFDIKNHMSALSEDAQTFLLNKFSNKISEPSPTQKETMQKEQVKKTYSKPPHLQNNKVVATPVPATSVKEVPVEEQKELVIQPMKLSDAAAAIDKPVIDLILTLLHWGIVSNINQYLSEDIIKRIARHYHLKPVGKPSVKTEGIKGGRIVADAHGTLQDRLPVVVVLGHVDHGKTTLLDFIRKTRVVAKEKGGITQHLGAYQAKTSHGNLVFLDTPGHEAFPKMRQRGIKVADLAILIIAADDGIMPQTVEVIKNLKTLNIPIVVAINKVDKASPVGIEKVKRQLAEYDLLPEEWGGHIVCVPISAVTGQNVDQLVEMVALQAQLLELKASVEGMAKCYVLESKLEKGRGVVATLICQQGTLRVGDYFTCGSTTGRVNAIRDSYGNFVESSLPSIPVQVSGFKQLPEVGDLFSVIDKADVRKTTVDREVPSVSNYFDSQEDTINIIIKADANSSKEALVDSIHQLSKKADQSFAMVHTGIGNINEGDVELAFSTNSIIVGLHVKAESNAIQLAKRRKVSIELYSVIYKLLEALEERAEKEKPIETERVKVGDAIVRKVFDIKGVGVIAGSYLQDGKFLKEGYVVAWRGRQKLGEGKITSLQRDKKTVKDVRAGFEFGFVVEGITDWQVDDRAECFMDMPK